MFSITNPEYMVLALIFEKKEISGYVMNQLVEERGYRAWADIGMTSIYQSIKKLEKKALITGKLDKARNTRGPAAMKYTLTRAGLALLKEETLQGLSNTRERDPRFDLAMSAFRVFPRQKVHELIGRRVKFLQAESSRIVAVRKSQEPELAFEGRILFKHTQNFIACEIKFLKNLADQLKGKLK